MATAKKSGKSKATPKKPASKAKGAPVTKAVGKVVAKKVAKAPPKKLTKPAKPVSKGVKAPTKKPPAVKVAAKSPAKKAVAKKSVAKPMAKPVSKSATKNVAQAKPKLTVNKKAKPGKVEAGKVGAVKTAPVKSVSKPSVKESSKVTTPAVVVKPRSASAKPEKATKTVSPNGIISEAQLLRMPEKDYMNEVQLAFFRHRLQEMENELRQNADETTEHLRETVIVPDPADRATIEEEHALELRTRDRERKLLKKVQQVLALIEAGEYGYCEETGEPIGIPRLLARPTATLSLEAQQRRELKQKMYGD